jgi:hypothetical protein
LINPSLINHLGGRVVDIEVGWVHTQTFLASTFGGAERHRRRLLKVAWLLGSANF